MAEVLQEGSDLTIVTYGANVRLTQAVLPKLAALGISCKLIDVQCLLPFDGESSILQSLMKTHAVLFFDKDCTGGASAYMLQKVLEEQGAFDLLDCRPRTLTAKDHRSPYDSDRDYFTKPNEHQLFGSVYEIMREGILGVFQI